jgi:hypothetical protein
MRGNTPLQLGVVEHRAREANRCAQERGALRAKECPALLKTLKKLITKTSAEVLPKSALSKACTDARNQWERWERDAGAGHGMVKIDRNWAENGMRGVALARKNWLQIGSESAGPKVAALLSVLESCKRIGVNVREYLLGVLPLLSYEAVRPQLQGTRPLEELAPAGWRRARAGNDGAAEQSQEKKADKQSGLVVRPWARAVGKETKHPERRSDTRPAGEGVLGWAHTVGEGIRCGTLFLRGARPLWF